MSPVRFLKILLACVLGAAGLTAALAQEQAGDGWPVKYKLITPEQLPEELGQGALVKMPLGDFESLHKQARLASQKNKLVPSLMRSAYKAELTRNSLVGTGEWSVHNAAAGPAVLPLPSLNLALNRTRDAADQSPAIIGEVDGKNLGLVVLKPGVQNVAFDWSAHGTLSPAGLHFDLRLPACPLASLDLEVPKDLVVSVPRSTALQSELKSKDPAKRIWQLSLTGKAQIEFDVRPLAGTNGQFLSQLAQVEAVQEITPDKVRADFKFQVNVPNQSIRELVFDCDPLLTPYEVILPAETKGAEILKWHMSRAKAGQPAVLTIELREPFQGTLTDLQIRCLAARPTDIVWTSPYVRLHHALTRGEKLTLLVHAEVPLQKWDGGSFLLLKSDRTADGMLMMSLEDPRTTDGYATPFPQRRPSFLGKAQGLDLHTRQRTWWHLGPQGMILDTEITYDMARGNLYQLLVRLPKVGKAWRVEKIAATPAEKVSMAQADLLQSWSTTDQLLTVDLRSGVTPGKAVKLSLQLLSLWDNPGRPGNTELDFPDLEPFHAAMREGTFHIDVDPIFQASVLKHSVPAAFDNQDGPWKRPALFSFLFHNQAAALQALQPSITGRLRLLPSSDRLQSFARSKVTLAAAGAWVKTRLELEPLMGNLDQCDFLIARGGKASKVSFEKPSGRTVRLQPLSVEEKLPYLLGLGNPAPFSWLTLLEAVDGMQMWRLRFSPPLTQKETILLETAGTPRADHWWDVPLIGVLDTPRRQGEVVLETNGTALGSVLAHGLVLPAQRHAAPLELRRLPVEAGSLPVLCVQTSPAAAVLSRQEHLDHARLQSYLLEDGRVLHHLSLQAANWAGKDITIRLASGSKVLAAKVAGLWQDGIAVQTMRHDVEVRLPVPAGLAVSRKGDIRSLQEADLWNIDLYYSDASTGNWSSLARCDAPWPWLPITPLTRQRTWYLAPGLAPLRQDLWQNMLMPAALGSPGHELIRKTWQIGDPLFDYFSSRASEDKQLRAAESELRNKWPSTMTLGEALERLAADNPRDRALVVIDGPGLAAAGLGPATPISKASVQKDEQPFWEALGLASISCPSGIVLTTRQQWQNWKTALSPRDLDPAVRQALIHGRDRQGLFYSVWNWLRAATDATRGEEFFADGTESPSGRAMPHSPGGFPHGLFAGQPPSGWTVWQPRGSLQDEPALDVVRTADVRLLAYVLGLAALLLSWWLYRAGSGVSFFRALLMWTAVWGLAFFWLPTSLQTVALGPLLASWGFALLAYLLALHGGVRPPRQRGRSTQTMVKGPGSSVSQLGLLSLLLVCVPALSSQNVPAGKADPFLVRVLPGPADAPDKGSALVSQKLLAWLNDQLNAPLSRQSAMLTAAEYRHGHIKGYQAIFQAQFDIYCFTEKSELVLPLTGVVLQEGARLQPLDANGTKDARVSAAVPALLAPLEDQTGYKLPIAGKGFHRLTLSFIAGWQNIGDFQDLRFRIPRLPQSRLQLTVPGGWRNVQVPYCQGDEEVLAGNGQQEVRANLGREDTVHVRWRQGGPAAAATTVEVRELYLWDLRPAHFALTGLLTYNVVKGAVNQLQIDIPDNVEIQSIELGSSSAAAGARITQWRLDPGRRVHIDLANPVAGKLQVILNLVPRLALDSRLLQLKLPLPHNVVRQEKEGALAYRLEGWQSIAKMATITGIAPDLFAKEWKSAAGQSEPGPLTRAYSFRRTPGPAQLQVILQPIRPAIQQDTSCLIHPDYTDVAVRIQARGSKDVPVTHLQCDVPPQLTLTGVTGPGVLSWSRSDNVVNIWLVSPTPVPLVEANVVLTGWVKNVIPQVGDRPGRFFLPCVRQPAYPVISQFPPQQVDSTVRIQPGDGCLVEPEIWGPFWSRQGGLVDLQETVLEKTAGAKDRRDPASTLAPATVYRARAAHFEGTFQILPAPPRPEVHMLTTAGLSNGIFSFSTRVDCQFLRAVPVEAGKAAREEGQITMTLHDWPAEVRLDPLQPEVKRTYTRQGNDHTWKFTLWKSTLPPGQLWPLSVQVHGQTVLGPQEKMVVPEMDVAHAEYRGRWLVWNGPEPRPQTAGLQAYKDLARIQRYWPAETNRLGPDSLAWQVKDPVWQLKVQSPATSAPRPWKILWADHEIHHQDGRWLHQLNCFITTRAAAELPVELPAGARFQAACWGGRFINPRLDDPRHLVLQVPQDSAGQILRLRWSYADADEPLLEPRRDTPVFTGANDPPTPTTLWLPTDLALAADAARGKQEQLGQNVEKTGQRSRSAALVLPQDGLPLTGLTAADLPLRLAARTGLGLAVVSSQLLLVGVFALFFLSYLSRLFWALPALWPEQLLLVGTVGTLLLGFSLLGTMLLATAVLGRMIWVVLALWRLANRLFFRAAKAPRPMA